MLAVAVVVAGLVAAGLATQGGDTDRRAAEVRLDPAAAARAAERACNQIRAMEEAVRVNARADRVLDLADAAAVAARRAQRLDPTWTPLAGGVLALRRGLDTDDAALARDGIDVVHTACARARELRGTP